MRDFFAAGNFKRLDSAAEKGTKGSTEWENFMKERYYVRKPDSAVNWNVKVPGSKSMTNRALLMAAVSSGTVVLKGVLFSDDSRNFMECLKSLGFETEVLEKEQCVKIKGENGTIPKKQAQIYVGSAGTAARFLTAMLGMSDGTYVIQASEQMKKRPMKELFDLLEQAGAQITYLEKQGFLPIQIVGRCAAMKDEKKLCVQLDISKSTQFLSALLLTAPMNPHGICIEITSEKKDGSYIRITRKMMQEWGVCTVFDGKKYEVEEKAVYQKKEYEIEPDMSAACYFYAAAAVTGGTALAEGVHWDNTQGDLKFLNVLEQMGCMISDSSKGITVKGPKDGSLKGISVDMNDFSDQTMTLAAIAPFAASEVHICHIGHIRFQECDRIHAIASELARVGIRCEEKDDALIIYPGKVHGAIIQTYDDHRMAMAFSLLGLRTDGIVIDNPMCCKKTFETYFELLDELTKA